MLCKCYIFSLYQKFVYNKFMEILEQFYPNKNLSIALGFFDGVHLAHREIIKNAVDFAKKNGVKSAVVSFKESPAGYFLGKKIKTIQTLEDRIRNIEELGIDYLYLLDFSEIVKYSAENYVKLLVENFSPKAITTGFNHTFGAKKQGNPNLLKDLSKTYGFEYFEIQPQSLNGQVVSSTLIRTAIKNGEIETANQMLTKPFSLTGEVVYGRQLGRTIGFKTANINYPDDIVKLQNGVYGSKVIINHETYNGISNLGVKPTITDDNQVLLEVNLFDFDGDIYRKEIKVEFIEKIRDEKKFDSLESLKTQIQKDVEYWRNKQ